MVTQTSQNCPCPIPWTQVCQEMDRELQLVMKIIISIKLCNTSGVSLPYETSGKGKTADLLPQLLPRPPHSRHSPQEVRYDGGSDFLGESAQLLNALSRDTVGAEVATEGA